MKKAGFTLVEMMIVVLIIGIMSVAFIPRIAHIQSRARDTARSADMRNISQAIEIYALDHGGFYPVAPLRSYQNYLVASLYAQSGNGSTSSTIQTIGSAISPYIKSLPKDPGKGMTTDQTGTCTPGGDYFSYYTDRIGSMYAITATRESKTGNTDNCRGMINTDKGSLQTVGKGLSYSSAYLRGQYYPESSWTAPECFTVNSANGILTAYNNTNPECPRDVIIPQNKSGVNITSINQNAFLNRGLTSIVIPYTVTTIGNNAFQGNQLTSVAIPESVVSIGNYAFQGNQLTSINIPNSVTTIGTYAFRNNQLTSVNIPNSVTTIGTYAFDNNQLTNVILPEGITAITANAFSYNNIESIVIPSSVTSIGNNAFLRNSLTSATLPDGLKTIGATAFAYNNLTSIVIPSTVTSIGSNGFRWNGQNKASGNLASPTAGSTQNTNAAGTAWVRQP